MQIIWFDKDEKSSDLFKQTDFA